MLRFAIFLGCFLAISSAYGQDAVYSLFRVQPIATNVALTSFQSKTYSVGILHRTQWRTVTVPYVTNSLSFSATQIAKQTQFTYSGFVQHDVAGDGALTVAQLIGGFSAAKQLNKRLLLSLGASVGANQNRVNYSAFTFGDQFNPYLGSVAATSGEQFANNRFYTLNFNVGTAAEYSFGRTQKRLRFGLGAHNLNRANYKFFGDEPLRIRYAISAELLGYEWNSIELVPYLAYFRQYFFQQTQIGVRAVIHSNFSKGPQSLELTFASRLGDAWQAQIGVHYYETWLYFAFDAGWNNLSFNATVSNAFELGLRIDFNKQNQNQDLIKQQKQQKKCSVFI